MWPDGTAGWVRWTILRWVSSRPCQRGLDTRLYLPKDWVEDCRRAHIPEEPTAKRSLRWSWSFGPPHRPNVAVDGGYGKDPAFLRGLETVHAFWPMSTSNQRIWLDDPAPYRPATTSRGRPVRRTDRPALTVAEWAASSRSLPGSGSNFQGLRPLKAGSARSGMGMGFRLVRRENTPSHFVFSNADASTSWLSNGCRIEHAFREAKSELAMADYQVRRWDAWHRHMRWSWLPCFSAHVRRLLQAEDQCSLWLTLMEDQLYHDLWPKPSYCQHHS